MCEGVFTGVRGAVTEILLGEQQQGFAVHLEAPAGDGAQRKLMLRPAQPLGHVITAPVHRLQTCTHTHTHTHREMERAREREMEREREKDYFNL